LLQVSAAGTCLGSLLTGFSFSLQVPRQHCLIELLVFGFLGFIFCSSFFDDITTLIDHVAGPSLLDIFISTHGSVGNALDYFRSKLHVFAPEFDFSPDHICCLILLSGLFRIFQSRHFRNTMDYNVWGRQNFSLAYLPFTRKKQV
jgi:hypothetical protein